jgi:hypothetical protein
MMKFTLLCFVSLCMFTVVRAQDVPVESGPFMEMVASAEVQSLSVRTAVQEPSGYYSVQREMYKIPQEPGQRMMKVGRALTIAGSALVITGILVYNNRDPNYVTQGTYGTTYGDDPHEAGGQLLVGVGVGMIVPGVMVWIHGASKYRKYVEKNAEKNAGIYIPAGKLGLGYRF